MKVYGQPGQVVQKRLFVQGRYRIVVWFRFDDKGIAILDESKVSQTDIDKLKHHFKVEQSEVVTTQIELTDEQIRLLAKDKGIKSWHTKAIKTLKGELNL